MLTNTFIVMRRELGAIFSQPVAYIFTFLLVSFTGFFFWGELTAALLFQGFVTPDPRLVFNALPFILMLLIPALTMRLLANERSNGTIELLMTLPLRDGEVVMGKFLAGLVAYLPTLALTSLFVVLISLYGNPDPGVLLAAYLGNVLYVCGLLGLGTLASAMSNSQLSAWLIGFLFALALYISDFPAQVGVLNETANTVFRELSFRLHLENFMRGLITAKDVAYYVLVTAVSLFAATRILESRRWR